MKISHESITLLTFILPLASNVPTHGLNNQLSKIINLYIFLGFFVLNVLTKLSCFVCSGNRQQRFGSDREDSHGLLEAQHAELKRKVRLTGFSLYTTFYKTSNRKKIRAGNKTTPDRREQ